MRHLANFRDSMDSISVFASADRRRAFEFFKERVKFNNS